MGMEIRYRFRKGLELKAQFDLFRTYLRDNPIPGQSDIILELAEAEIKNDIVAWTWEWSRSMEQILWQAACDQWFRKNFEAFSSKGAKGVWVKIMRNDKKNEQEEAKSSELIRGEGLVEFKAVAPKFKMDRLIVPDELKEEIYSLL